MSRETKIVTPEHVELTFELAGLGSRFIALLLDMLVQSGVVVLLVLAILFLARITPDIIVQRTSAWVIAIAGLVIFALISCYFIYFEAVKNGQTPGKQSAGIRVIRDTGHPVDFRSALLRNLMRAVDILPGIYTVGFISIFVSPQYRRLGDIVAGTLVVKTRPYAPPNALAETAEVLPAASAFPEAALPYLNQITRDDYRTVRHLLDRRHELEPELVYSLAIKIAEPLTVKLHIDRTEISDPVEFLHSLAAEWERRMIR